MTTLQSDPRIISPEIKVVYPSQTLEKADTATEQSPTDLPVAQSLPAQPQQYQPAPDAVSATTDSVAASNTTSPVTLSGWKEVISQNMTLFLIVGIAALAIGIVIGKKSKCHGI